MIQCLLKKSSKIETLSCELHIQKILFTSTFNGLKHLIDVEICFFPDFDLEKYPMYKTQLLPNDFNSVDDVLNLIEQETDLAKKYYSTTFSKLQKVKKQLSFNF